ncbi:MAG: hypothetical protein M1825_005195 [Sarcosagium campestre]|nr:MAG: hypothetical protein M1825_005195 [Sarcosagium campestre]
MPNSTDSMMESAAPAPELDLTSHDSSRRHRPMKSGGFLLDPAFELDRSQVLSGKKEKNKGKSTDRRLSSRRHRSQQPSIGSSPLALEVTTLAASDNGEDGQSSKETTNRTSIVGSTISNDTHDSNASHRHHEVVQHHVHKISSPPAVGFDTDSAQIVNLALGLSESRRLSANHSKNMAPNGGLDRRSVSANLPVPAGSTDHLQLRHLSTGGSLEQYLQPQRRNSRNTSPRHLRNSRVPSDASPSEGSQSYHARSHIIHPPFLVNGADEVPIYKFSSSTIARAERAKESLELAAAYRRLLDFMPPLNTKPVGTNQQTSLPSSPKSQEFDSTISRVTSHSSKGAAVSRKYNPLQSIRNRKVRARERKSLDPEAQGWTDTTNVVKWVDQVELESTSPAYHGTLRVHLPPLWKDESDETIRASAGTDVQGGEPSPLVRPKRPRNDWLFSPQELLADAFWIEQAENKRSIEDRDGNKLYPRDTSFGLKSPGKSTDAQRRKDWHRRKTSNIDVHDAGAGDLEGSDGGDAGTTGTVRGRRLQKLQGDSRPHEGGTGSRLRRYPWRKSGNRSGGASDSDSSDDFAFRGIKSVGSKRIISDGRLDSAVLERQMMDLLQKEAEEYRLGSVEAAQGTGETHHSTPGFHQRRQSRERGARGTSSAASTSRRRRSSSTDQPGGSEPVSRRVSLTADREQHQKRSLDGLDDTAPNSPRIAGHRRSSQDGIEYVPSIAMDLSPPQSRPESREGSPNQRGLRKSDQKLGSQRNERLNAHDRISEEDFGEGESNASATSPHGQADRNNTRDTVIQSVVSPTRKPFIRNGTSESLGRRIRPAKLDNLSDASRIRGMFKGGRLEEIVRSEVSRVGDFLWKKDGSGANSNATSSGSSFASDSSASEDEGHGKEARSNRMRSNHSAPESAELSRESTNKDGRYHTSQLPSFTSSVQRHGGPSEKDPITRQQLERRAQGKSPRLQQLELPRIDMTHVSPNSSPELSRVTTRDGPGPMSDVSDAHEGVKVADSRLNAALMTSGRAGAQETRGELPMITGLAGLDASARRSVSARRAARGSAGTSRNASSHWEPVTKRDVVRVAALFLSSGVKAQEIVRRARECSETHPLVRFESDAPLPRVPRCHQHLVVGRDLSERVQRAIETGTTVSREFSRTGAEKLKDQMSIVEQRAGAELTPVVRAASDDADAFSTELSSTRTLDVKDVRDRVDTLLRRRRKRLRWVRRIGFALLEWALLGFMWWVWLIVVVVRLVRGTVKAVNVTVRWLLCL